MRSETKSVSAAFKKSTDFSKFSLVDQSEIGKLGMTNENEP